MEHVALQNNDPWSRVHNYWFHKTDISSWTRHNNSYCIIINIPPCAQTTQLLVLIFKFSNCQISRFPDCQIFRLPNFQIARFLVIQISNNHFLILFQIAKFRPDLLMHINVSCLQWPHIFICPKCFRSYEHIRCKAHS